jgi:hypothetical protein
MDASDFMLEDTREEKERRALKKGIEGVKQVAYEILGRANGLYKRAARENDPSPTIVGKAIAYLTCFIDLAKVLGIPATYYQKTVGELYERLGALMTKVEENSKTTIVQHRRDPEGIKVEAERVEVEKKKLELREIKVEREANPAPAPASSNNTAMIEDMVGYLKGLGYDKSEARKRAEIAYQPGVRIEELVAAACRL